MKSDGPIDLGIDNGNYEGSDFGSNSDGMDPEIEVPVVKLDSIESKE